MGIERTIYCDGPDCGDGDGATNVRTASPAPYLPHGILEVRSRSDQGDHHFYFCGWDCLMKYAAAQELPEVFPFYGDFDA